MARILKVLGNNYASIGLLGAGIVITSYFEYLLPFGWFLIAVCILGLIYRYRDRVLGCPTRKLLIVIPERIAMKISSIELFANELNMENPKTSTFLAEREGYYGLAIELDLVVTTPPLKVTQLQLCIGKEIINPISPFLPLKIKRKRERHTFRYEVSYAIAEGSLDFVWEKTCLCAIIRGQKGKFYLKKLPFPSS
ncbi:MAG TPA: hypothetical protein G4O03_08115 [Dehalococcoidia bacterium]|jgi:hypothetical protein|nr:hypothetical protein [Dehalococcoidia bacterium]